MATINHFNVNTETGDVREWSTRTSGDNSIQRYHVYVNNKLVHEGDSAIDAANVKAAALREAQAQAREAAKPMFRELPPQRGELIEAIQALTRAVEAIPPALAQHAAKQAMHRHRVVSSLQETIKNLPVRIAECMAEELGTLEDLGDDIRKASTDLAHTIGHFGS